LAGSPSPEAIWFSGYEDRVIYDEAGLFNESMQSTSSVKMAVNS
jgi:hypothetical protein